MSLQARKSLLIAESELNRAHLRQHHQSLRSGLQSITERSVIFHNLVSAGLTVAASLAAYKTASKLVEPPSKWQKFLNVAKITATLWMLYQERGVALRATAREANR